MVLEAGDVVTNVPPELLLEVFTNQSTTKFDSAPLPETVSVAVSGEGTAFWQMD